MASSYFAPKQFIKAQAETGEIKNSMLVRELWILPCNKTRAQEKKNDADKGINILIFTLYTIQGLKYFN